MSGDLNGATSPSPEAAYPGTPGEFAADWNSWDETRRAAFLAAMVRNAQDSTMCFMADHQGLLEEVRALRAQTSNAYAEGWQDALATAARELRSMP